MYLSSLQDLDKIWQFVKQLSPSLFFILVNSELVLSHLLLHPPYLYTVSFSSISRWDISILLICFLYSCSIIYSCEIVCTTQTLLRRHVILIPTKTIHH